ncbi:MAG: DUF4375 domain-containing protein [Planctomycetes bacterium]|nr:DUF4375 domain-containing protein [Planctomycetota bacterium]MCB9826343.1 DUF4375 domain-containing protein [Planctomycetota bacterium]MCB9830564.1 DUF4375 domain-containing protein [Planctomycetota bacterium]MCB9901139.1 DUF4375 domain-containing protein [Planctomycetota bacterium]
MDLRDVPLHIDREFIAHEPVMRVLDPVYWTAVTDEGRAAYDASLAAFSTRQRQALGVFWYGAEVDNGGHVQFFENSTGQVWRDALGGLEAMGLEAYAALLREAAERLGPDLPDDQEERQERLGFTGAQFDDLDRAFDKLRKEKDLLSALQDWVREHADDFLFEGVIRMPEA